MFLILGIAVFVIYMLSSLHAIGGTAYAFDWVINEIDQLTGFHIYNNFLAYLFHPTSFFKGVMSDPEHIEIDIEFLDYQKLAYKREIALKADQLIATDEDYVPARIRYGDEIVNVKLRLKGDVIDQLQGEKWSFRIKVLNDNTLFGMRVFSLQAPEARNYLEEWLFHKALRQEDILSLRYDFVDVTINGEHKGIYALEEHFDKQLIEYCGFREGPILKFNEELWWANLDNFRTIDGNLSGLMSIYSAEIDAFRMSRIQEDPILFDQFITGMSLLESFREGTLTTSQVFNVDKMATFIAITDLLGGQHALSWHNLRFYYNPVTSMLEPIGFDAEVGARDKSVGVIGLERQMSLDTGQSKYVYDVDDYYSFTNMLFADPVFFTRYMRELERVSQPAYLENLLVTLNKELEKKLNILYRDYPWYTFPLENIQSNQEFIRNVLNPVQGLRACFSYYDPFKSSITLEIGNIQALPVVVTSLTNQQNQVFELMHGNSVLQAKVTSEPVIFERLTFALPEGIVWSDESIAELKVNYHLLGANVTQNEDIIPYVHLEPDFLQTDFILRGSNVERFGFINVDDSTNIIHIVPGTWELKNNLVIPAGYTVVCDKGTTINLTGGAGILSYSPLRFIGTDDEPITITSSDSINQGVVVLQASKQSVLHNVVFSQLSPPARRFWRLTGAITFYESPVEIRQCHFLENTTGDDLLNIIRSEFSILDSCFENPFLDALDFDFSQGSVSDTSFYNSGNDAVDFSGSIATFTNGYIDGTGDKGISIGENSNVEIFNTEFLNCNLAIASKDMSEVRVTGISVSSCTNGIAVYQKKSEYGPAMLEATDLVLTDVITPYICEENSILIINEQKIADDQQDVYATLYNE